MKCDSAVLVCQCLTIFHSILDRLARLQSASSPTVFGVVVDEHVVRHCQDVAVYTHSAGQDHLRVGERKKRQGEDA